MTDKMTPAKPNRPRILCLGLDAADKDLIAEWTQAGALPTFKAMFESSAFSPMTTPPGQYAGSVWPSFFTSVTPARHGRYFHTQLRRGGYEYEPFQPKDLKKAPFWEALSDAGLRVSVVDVPKAPEAGSFNGTQILDWGTHDPESEHVRAFPTEFGNETAARYGHDPVGRCDRAERDAAGLTRLRDALCERAGTKARIVKDVLAESDSNLTLAVFSESHCAGHQLWHLHDPTHPNHDPKLAATTGDLLKDVYVALDRAVGEVLAGLDPATIVILFTSHGMGAHFDGSFLLNEIVSRLQTAPTTTRQQTVQGMRLLWDQVPDRLKRQLRSRAGVLLRKARGAALKGQDFFAVLTNDNCGGIRVNLKGREANGRIQAGEPYERLIAQITADLAEIVNEETGEPIVLDVLRTDRLFEGPWRDDLPDLNVAWNQTAPIRKISSPKIDRIEREYSGRRTGDHRDQGFLWGRGPGIEPGPLHSTPSIMDIGPTLAALLGVPLSDVDGNPIVFAKSV